MITLIGTRASVIGFGLCGIQDIHEVTEKTKEDKITKLIKEAEHEVVMIDEDILKKVEDLDTEKTIISIPSRHAEEPEEDIDALVRDTIGVNIQT